MKEPKEEAEEIFEMFRRIFCLDIDDVQINLINLKYIKQCAILHVEGIMSVFEPISLRINNVSILYLYDEGKDQYHYWKEVLQIIKSK